MDIEKQTLTESEAALYIGFSKSFLRNGRVTGTAKTPKFTKVGRAVRYFKDDLDQWLNSLQRYDHLAQLEDDKRICNMLDKQTKED